MPSGNFSTIPYADGCNHRRRPQRVVRSYAVTTMSTIRTTNKLGLLIEDAGLYLAFRAVMTHPLLSTFDRCEIIVLLSLSSSIE